MVESDSAGELRNVFSCHIPQWLCIKTNVLWQCVLPVKTYGFDIRSTTMGLIGRLKVTQRAIGRATLESKSLCVIESEMRKSGQTTDGVAKFWSGYRIPEDALSLKYRHNDRSRPDYSHEEKQPLLDMAQRPCPAMAVFRLKWWLWWWWVSKLASLLWIKYR